MRLEDLRPTPGAMKKRKRVGRGPGSGHGKTSGRGHKGQKARGSGKVHIWFEGGQTPLHRRLPKRGFNNINKKVYAVVNVKVLEERFEANEEVTPEKLIERKIIKDLKDGIKILGDGELTKPLVVKAHAFSKSAVEKIESAGGKAEVI
ncbi:MULTISPECIES: 50S ribosomal protein L15 [Thermotoga]|jgi:large subunit ribosomal protein L15|uniref:Large ribosomal subunit protein uL15 n=2 Tax=Thermotoga TaxID=2335 RepID=RL15_THEP1|nr:MULTISPECIES: 50S ribosomal protein L15 [Thermotoga]A5IMA2.1 RecName: Full=Large ribosomal subunit protein uL15; AltName: Full=50S ribosomal protein L15 [Thermotoga petrophila RKU-1]B1LBM1.1 RecName: Full=Large ribosomal subunit protein uL15; AltName: Full=50S ribosomal protein L15 [Thermotoga sp. RQ2]MDK2897947.1 large subunit ribosomal protein [Thermotoga sp.]ABQ47325.1 LSU ribosomal protein L15P [Thermotoga petrophila RKU-1]ACB09719.1 ribosomal protein L15 [Thermotoga sp. RQ2]AIY88633.1